MKQQKIASFAPGLNNRLPPDQLDQVLPDGTPATFLREAINCDINTRGAVRRRAGYTRTSAGVVHSVWGDGAEQGYAVIDGVLNSVLVGADGRAALTPIMFVGYRRLSYSRGAQGEVYWSDGIKIGRLIGGMSGPASTATPPEPVMQVIAGALPAGRYLLAFTRVGVAGESAATPPAPVEVSDRSGIELSGCANGTEVFMSGPNGEVLQHVGTAWGDTFTITLPPVDGRQCETLGLAPMPPGSIVRHALGRFVVAEGKTLTYSEPYRYGLYNPAEGYLQFSAPITVVAPTQNGLYVCAEQTYWLPSLPPSDVATVLPFGALACSDVFLDAQTQDDQYCAWMSSRGVVVATNTGTASLVQDGVMNYSGAERGSTMVRGSSGERNLVITRTGVQPDLSKARDEGI